MIDKKAEAIYEEFRCELGIHERDIVDAQKLHRDLVNKNPFRYESPYLVSAVCVYAISHIAPQEIPLQDIDQFHQRSG